MTTPFRILVVDDDQDIVRGVSVRLRAAGYEIVTACDGQAGFVAAVQNRPDAIVLDIQLPMIDGYAVLQGLLERPETRDIPVVVLSANVADRAKRRALELGARCFLGKPYNAAQLIGALQAVLSAGGQEQGKGGQQHHGELAAEKNDSGGRR